MGNQDVYNKVAEMICDAKDMEPDAISPQMTLTEINFDSLDYVELMVLAKREFGVTLTSEYFIDKPNLTLGELCDLLEKKENP